MSKEELKILHEELDKVTKEINECASHYSPKLYNKKRELTKKIKLLEKGNVDAKYNERRCNT